MNRRQFLGGAGAGAVAALAGCFGAPGGDPGGRGSGTPSDTETDGEPTPTPLPEGGIDYPEGPQEELSIPDDLTEESVAEFAKYTEYGIVYNDLWSENATVSVSCDVHEVTETEVGWKAVVSCRGYTEMGGDPIPNSTATTTPLHGDYFRQYYTYLVDGDTVVRRRATDAEKPR